MTSGDPPREGITLVLTTVPDESTGRTIGARLVEEQLIACANMVPNLTSIFRWRGEATEETEVLVLMKTRIALVERLFERISELHPYEVPEMVSVGPDAVSRAYASWVRTETEVHG